MTPEELLKPRFKFIAPYPGSTQEVGSVTTEIATASYFRTFKANFRELYWWEERKESDMPEYVKAKNACCIITMHLEKNEVCRVSDLPDKAFEFFLPATESEYLNQKK